MEVIEVLEDGDDQVGFTGIMLRIPTRLTISKIVEQFSQAVSPRIHFQVHYHQTYQVPVLYFFLRDMPGCRQIIDQVYQYVVDDQWKSTVREVGVIGGISQTVSFAVSDRL